MKVHKDGWNVATSPRRDAPTSQRWVNYYKSHQAATSRRLNVATSARVMPLHHEKQKGDQNSRHRGSYERGHGNQSSSDIDLEEEPVICIFLLFWTGVLMFYILHIGVFLFNMF